MRGVNRCAGHSAPSWTSTSYGRKQQMYRPEVHDIYGPPFLWPDAEDQWRLEHGTYLSIHDSSTRASHCTLYDRSELSP